MIVVFRDTEKLGRIYSHKWVHDFSTTTTASTPPILAIGTTEVQTIPDRSGRTDAVWKRT
jgi:hypothetical protein